MQFQCSKCNKKFHYPAKLTEAIEGRRQVVIGNLAIQGDTKETHLCPFCQSLSFTEYVEPTAQVENVYIYDLTSGRQTDLDVLLAQGYVIVNRYSKQYHLEKPKSIPSKETVEDMAEVIEKFKNPDPDDNQVFIDQEKTTAEFMEAMDKTEQIGDASFEQARAAYKKLKEKKQP